MAFNSYRPPPRRYNQANEAGWVQNLLGKTLGGAGGPQVHRVPLVTKIIAASSLAAMLAQPIPNLLANTLKPAGAHELNLEAGSYAITGADLTPLADRTLNLEAGSYALTGADLTPLAGRALDLEAGTYATTGADLTPLAGRALDLEAGAYALTGADATTLADRTLDLEAGSYAITGADLTTVYVPTAAPPFFQNDWRNPQLRVPFHQPSMYRPAEAAPAQPGEKPFPSQDWPNPSRGPLNLAAYGYTVRLPENQKPFLQTDWPNPRTRYARQDFIRGADRTLYTPVGAYSLNLESGSYALTGADLTALADRSLNLEAGVYTLTGAGATLDHSGTPTAYDLNLEAGAYSITGADLTTQAARILNLETGNYALTGSDLTTSVARSLNLEAGVYSISGADLPALASRSLDLEAGTYTITGDNATLVYSGTTSDINTNNEKLAMMEWCQVWEPGLPFDPTTIDQAAQQQFLWDYPGILWGEVVPPTVADYLYWFRRKIHGQT